MPYQLAPLNQNSRGFYFSIFFYRRAGRRSVQVHEEPGGVDRGGGGQDGGAAGPGEEAAGEVEAAGGEGEEAEGVGGKFEEASEEAGFFFGSFLFV